MNNKLQQFPEKLLPLHAKIVIYVGQPLGPTADIFVREVARMLPHYNEQIICNASGVDIEGKKIAVNTVGRWLFGVPGFRGHVRIVPQGNTINVYYPEQAPQIVHDLLYELKRAIEEVNY